MKGIIALLALFALAGCVSVPATPEEAFSKYEKEGCSPSLWSTKQAAYCLSYAAAQYCDARFGLESSWKDRSKRSSEWVACGQDRYDYLAAQYLQQRQALSNALTQSGQTLIEDSNKPMESSSSYSPSSGSYQYSTKTGFLTGEGVSGLNKVCYYNVTGSTHAKNVGASEICPLTAKF
jgi:hypothetical protein